MLNEILQDVSDYIEWELEEGTLTAEVSADVLAELATAKPAPAIVQPASPAGPGPSVTPAPIPAKPKTPDRGVKPSPRVELSPLDAVAAEIAACKRCGLHQGRTNTVPGQGCPRPEILFVGEAPGRDEDEQGLAFVGRAGQLLTKMIEAMGFSRDAVFIANINKCRPPENRKPTREEMDTCLPFLKRQIAILKPKVIIAMGSTAVEGLVPMPEGEMISKVRGHWLEFEGIPLMPTYHPAYLLRNPAMKRPVWEDLKAVLQRLGHPIPAIKPESH